MDIRLHNTLSRRVETFTPIDPARVTMYACGPTVYNYAHIGNARPAVIFDLLARLLRRHYPKVVYARNITDVDDKINAAAAEQGVEIAAITRRFAAIYRDDMAALGVAPPDIEPLATEHIGAIITMIERLLASGHAYAAEGHVLFHVPSFRGYGQLSGRSLDEMIAGARVEVAPFKHHPADFVLWKPSPPELPGWDSPWGRGRPGWHIECSAMIASHLGTTIDIHAGGNDLIFPHHENEIAQSTCAHGGATFARYWLHNGFVTVEGRKMSKSLGNVLLVHDLRAQHPPEVLRYVLLSAHYRQPLDWSETALEQARRTLDRLYGLLREHIQLPSEDTELPASFEAALCDDLNTPKALAELAQLARALQRASTPAERSTAKSRLLGAARFIGLLGQDPLAWFQGSLGDDGENLADWVEGLLAQRQAARAARDFARADAIRDELKAAGIQIEDSPDGPRWRKTG